MADFICEPENSTVLRVGYLALGLKEGGYGCQYVVFEWGGLREYVGEIV